MVPPKYGVWDAAREILAELTFILPGYLEAKSAEREDWTAILATSRLSVIATSVDAPAGTGFGGDRKAHIDVCASLVLRQQARFFHQSRYELLQRHGFLERQQSRFVGDIAYRSIGDRVKLDALAGCAFGKGESGFLGRDFRRGEVTPYDQAAVRVEAEQRDRRQRFLSCLGCRGRIEKGASGVRFIGKRYGDLFLSQNRRIHFVRFPAARGKRPSTSMVVIQLFIGYALNGFIREMLRCSCSGTNVSLFFQ